MTSADMIPAAVLKRKAVVYVRQSTQSQVMTNLEGQRRQYDLVEVARQWGFADVEVIDDDLGRSASGMVARPGFERLVAWLCAGKVGAVLCFDASRLARNGRAMPPTPSLSIVMHRLSASTAARCGRMLWRQARQIVFTLESLRRRKRAPTRSTFPFSFRRREPGALSEGFR